MPDSSTDLDRLTDDLVRCRLCRETPAGRPLPHEPRPVFQIGRSARLCVASQAPGTRAHASGRPFTDPSGMRLRDWMGVSEAEFYDPARIAIVPMGFCFPGQDAKGGDLPPRRECAPHWRAAVFERLPHVELVLAIGLYAQTWHLGEAWNGSLTRTVETWRTLLAAPRRPRVLPLPHPSWRNNAWLKRHAWFEAELLPVLRREVRSILEG